MWGTGNQWSARQNCNLIKLRLPVVLCEFKAAYLHERSEMQYFRNIWSCQSANSNKNFIFVVQISFSSSATFLLIKNETQTAVINIVSFCIFVNLTFRMLFNIHFENDLKWPLKKMTRLYTVFQNYKGSGNEIKNLKILNSNEFKRQQLIKHQFFTATFL